MEKRKRTVAMIRAKQAAGCGGRVTSLRSTAVGSGPQSVRTCDVAGPSDGRRVYDGSVLGKGGKVLLPSTAKYAFYLGGTELKIAMGE